MKKTIFASILIYSFSLVSCGPSEKEGPSSTKSEPEEQVDENSPEEAEEMSRKKELLNSLVGIHTLESIEGLMGVNTMVDYSIHDAVWLASGSSNSGGTREAYPIELTNEDQKDINSLQISVSEDLTITFSASGKKCFSVPFSEELKLSLKKPVGDYNSVITDKISSATTFINEDLYLFAKDGFDEGALTGADILDIGADAVMLTYNESSKSFELSIFYADCCDAGIYTFK